MTEKEVHWMTDDATRRKFWVYAKGDLGLTEDEVHEALSVESTKDFDGDKDMALAMLKAYAVDIDDRRLVKSLKPQDLPPGSREHSVAFCDAFAPDGTRIAVTAREGATPDAVALTALALWDGVQILTRLGWTTAAENGKPAVAKLAQSEPEARSTSVITSVTIPEEQGSSDPSETYAVNTIVAQVTPNGKRRYAVKGGRCHKHGVSAWPEVAEQQVMAITGFDLATLQAGQSWTPTKKLRAVASVPEGVEWPNKVIAFAPAP